MYKTKFIGVVLVLLSFTFLILQLKGFEVEASGVKASAICLLTLLYFIKVKKKHLFFMLFLIVFSLSDIFNFVTWIKNFDVNSDIEYTYYIGNGLYILAYIFLIVRVLLSINVKKAFLKFPLQILSLVVLGVFVAYMVTDTATNATDELSYSQHILEYIYNAVLMFLLSISLINYMLKDDKKAMNFLIGCICILFSEILQLAYYYIANSNALNALCSLFLVFAFLFFYIQSLMVYQKNKYAPKESLEVNA